MYIHEQLMKARHQGWLRAAARNRQAVALRQARAEQAPPHQSRASRTRTGNDTSPGDGWGNEQLDPLNAEG